MRYLIVAHQTAQSSQLLAVAEEFVREDPEAEFVLLVPSIAADELLAPATGTAAEIADRRAEPAEAWFKDAGLRMVGAGAGHEDPVEAIGDALRRRQEVAAVILSTLPQGVSRWLRSDVVSRVRRQYPHLRVEHVVCELPATSPKAGEQ